MRRCINLDWLECYCLESSEGWPHDVAFFMNHGVEVVARPYGTRVYAEMFTIYDEAHEPAIEIRRNPISAKRNGEKSVLNPLACHIRLTNRSCYRDDAADYLRAFLIRWGFSFQRISRVDICLDFERFDKGDEPAAFMRRYMAGRYSKINQATIHAHGRDEWEARVWNSVSWGSPRSMVSTKFYCKSLELKEAKDKPYIRQAWAASGLVDDFMALTKAKADGTIYSPVIWRVEFSLKSSIPGWVRTEDFRGRKKQYISMRNTLGVYEDRPHMLDVFASLASRYFHFVKYKSGVRKDRCEYKVLFDFTSQNDFYAIARPATSRPPLPEVERLCRRLEKYLKTCVNPAVSRLIHSLLDELRETRLRFSAAIPWDADEVELLRRLLAYRVNGRVDEPVNVSLEHVQAVMQLERDLWSMPLSDDAPVGVDNS